MAFKFCKHGRQEATCPFCNDKEGHFCDCENPVFKAMSSIYSLGVCAKCSRPIPDGNSASKFPGLDKVASSESPKSKILKPKMLFVDDRTRRHHYAMDIYGQDYYVTIATCVPEALRFLSSQQWDVVSLDHDLNGYDFQNPEDSTSGMEIVRYITKAGWVGSNIFKLPEFWVHTSNLFAVHLMISEFQKIGIISLWKPIKYAEFPTGLIAGAFDVIHPGYIRMFRDAKRKCEWLIIALHNDPSLERPNKLKPILELHQRVEILSALKMVDEIIPYYTEDDLLELLRNRKPSLRILGSDYEGTSYTGDNLNIPVYYHVRDHEFSSTKYKAMILETMQKGNPK